MMSSVVLQSRFRYLRKVASVARVEGLAGGANFGAWCPSLQTGGSHDKLSVKLMPNRLSAAGTDKNC
jgi:hypothetical protein